ncbi:hypothetical protein MLD38_001488 [Melastoma candidum]|uniref:Uncharacterized protein n=1 Tax=Melastoma candidum TaxID=119954 RepID=A0ACB9SED4_9MYRT|nr:hypothetical protein MLD38_001488 [Melastoma candidum]
MKRIRDDLYPSSQFKRPFASSRGDSHDQSQDTVAGGGSSAGGNGGGGGGGGATQKLTTNDALSYLKRVKDMFQDQRDKYDMFLEVMKDFKAQRTDTAGVIARVKELFKGHNDLILGFNTFLPKGFEITVEDDETPTKKTVEFEEAISFVNKIKKRFQNDEHVYKSFLDILNMYRKEQKDIDNVYSEVAGLFEGHSDLLEEFTRFLPDNSTTTFQQSFPHGRSPLQHNNERNGSIPSMRQFHLDRQRNRRDRNASSPADRDISVDRPDLEDEKPIFKVHRDQKKPFGRENRDWRIREPDDRESKPDNIRDSQRFSDKRKPSRKGDGSRADPNLTCNDNKDALKSMYGEGFIFCDKVKERLGSADDYQAFLKCLHMYSNGIIKRNDLQVLVTDLLGKYPDLMDEFNDFLGRCENIDGFLAGVMFKRSLTSEGRMNRSVKVEEKDREVKREVEGQKEKERSKEKYMWKSIQELDLSDCQRCTPSYRLLPNDYPISQASQRSELGAQVFNDHWVSVTSGSEDYSFKHMRKNQYEESLFRCEDDRFELDMLLESVSSTAKRTEELLHSINEDSNNMEIPFQIENYFTALNLRCIERLYGDHGLDVMEILRKNPTLALPVILTRLKQKQEEWTGCRSDFNKVWADIYAKNHYKSLDHRSFYFKQQDSKNLSTKSLVAEIKELKERMQKDEDILLAIAAGSKQPIVPHMELSYADGEIHEDLHKLVQYSCEEVCSTKEQLNKVMRLWTTFLEPMLSIPHQPRGRDTEVDERTTQVHISSSHTENDGNSNTTMISVGQQNSGDTMKAKVSSGVTAVFTTNFPNGDASTKENGTSDVAAVSKIGPSHIAELLEKLTKSVQLSEKLHQLNVDGFSTELVNGAVKPILVGGSDVRTRPLATSGDGGHASNAVESTSMINEMKTNQDVRCSEAATSGERTESELIQDGSKLDRNTKGSHEPPQLEKEEGELSPNGDLEEETLPGQKDIVVKAFKEKSDVNDSERRSIEGEVECSRDGRGGNNIEGDDEDSENGSDRGDLSGSESTGDECSHEENEDDDEMENDDDTKAESEGEADGMVDAPCVVDAVTVPLSEHILASVKPLSKHLQGVLPEGRNCSRVFYGNDDFYMLFRLHQILYSRILYAKSNSTASDKLRNSMDTGSKDPYARFLSSLYNLLDGTIDNAKFEDECRSIIGNQSYMLFTLDKLIYKLVKQLQIVAADDMDNKLLQLYDYEKSRTTMRFIDSVYFENARVFLHDENVYRMEFSFAESPRLSIQLMDNVSEKPEVFAVSIEPNFNEYLQNDFLVASPSRKEPHDVFLLRNKLGFSTLDEFASTSSLEGVCILNGLECKIASNSSKTSYVLDTEDFFFRPRKSRKSLPRDKGSRHYEGKVEKFHRFLSAT